MREKLIELLSENFAEFCNVDIIAGNCKIRAITFDAEKFADHLIANGVTIPVRCKDCVHMENRFNARYCKIWMMFNGMGDDGFCNYGEGRTDG